MPSNEFLNQLLTLQPDGAGAISAPSNWHEPPLLHIETDLSKTAIEVAEEILLGEENKPTGRWHFFLGSPGNGKSAATGEIVRQLLAKGCRLQVPTADGSMSIKELEQGEIPYLVKVYEKGRDFETAWIAQDASVVRNPWSSQVNPAGDLAELIDEAWSKGVSLVVCANRGVIESAVRMPGYRDKKWHRTLSRIASDDLEAPEKLEMSPDGKPRFQDVLATGQSLDARSLLIGTTDFERLIDKATEDAKWEPCNICEVKNLCPFHANKDWLSSPDGREAVLECLSDAELLSGQNIVMREAVAFLSLVLSGCPRDYTDGDDGPCKWVQGRVEANDIFGLLSRRIYMVMFSSGLPRGIEGFPRARAKQEDGLKRLRDGLQQSPLAEAKNSAEQLSFVYKSKLSGGAAISTDVGLGHLLGAEGAIRELDPMNGRLDEDFFARWHPSEFELPGPLFSPLEAAAQQSWRVMFQHVEDTMVGALAMHNCLSRWCTSFTLRLGGLVDRSLFMHKSLTILKQLSSGNERQFRERSRELEKQLPRILGKSTNESIHVSLSDHVELRGHWVSEKLRPRIKPDNQRGRLGLMVSFGENREQLIPAEVFYWLEQRVVNGLSLQCFPQHLLETAENYLIRVAMATRYSVAEDDVELLVSRADGSQKILERRNGEVLVEDPD